MFFVFLEKYIILLSLAEKRCGAIPVDGKEGQDFNLNGMGSKSGTESDRLLMVSFMHLGYTLSKWTS